MDHRRPGQRRGLHREDAELAGPDCADRHGAELCVVYHRRGVGLRALLLDARVEEELEAAGVRSGSQAD